MRHGERLRVCVEDDGQGFCLAQSTDRLGLKGLREPVELAGGEISIASSAGSGTAVTVDLVLTEDSGA